MEETIPKIIAKEDIENLIYTIRGMQVMLDSDLAVLYGVETKVLNQAVKRNHSSKYTVFIPEFCRIFA